MLALLDGTGSILVDAIVEMFNKPQGGLTVEKTEKGAPFDLFVSDKEGRTLVIEATGIAGPFTKNDPHLADVLQYLPDHSEKNEHGRKERIVLVVNTYRNTEVEKRDRASDITPQPRQMVQDNHVCMIRSMDLYSLWLETVQGRSILEVFNELFLTEGVYEPKRKEPPTQDPEPSA